MDELELKPVLEIGAEVVLGCPNCSWEVKAEIGGPGDNHWETVDCPNGECDYRFGIRLEAESE